MIGATLDGRYVISRQLGEGGMGAVYEARHSGTGRRVAVKVITSRLAQDEAVMARFSREARAAGAIDSEHIAQVLDSGKDAASGLPYLVMEMLSGEDVDQLLRRIGPFPSDLALRVIAHACMGLQKAHNARVMHRDIKPANLFLTRRDGEIAVKLLDFGVAKIKMEEALVGQPDLTSTRSLVGSPLYMSPEQARSLRDIDFRTDIWSLGVVMYKMLTGRTPYEDTQALGDLLFSICSTPAPPLQRFAPWVAPEVAAIAHRALRIDRAERFQSASEMLQAVKALLPRGHAIREEMLAPLSDAARAEVAPSLEISAPGSAPTPVAQGPAQTWADPFAGTSAVAPPLRAESSPSLPHPEADRTTAPAVNAVTATAGRTKADKRRGVALLAALSTACVLAAGAATAWSKLGPPAHAPTPPAPSAVAALSASAAPATPAIEIDPERLASFGPLPALITSPQNPLTEEKIHLGRMLFFDTRLSKNHDLSCNTCHVLDRYGANNAKVPTGHAHQQGRRNTPGVYNTAGYFALLWDGRVAVLEEQATMPLLRADEMAMTAPRVEATLRSMPDYVKAFAKAFPSDPVPVTMANVAKALAAFERKLSTPGRWDRFLEGERDALTNEEKAGFNAFVDTGCISCHFGPHVGATMFQKLGLVRAWPDTMDRGRYDITQRPADFMVFRVPSLRDVAETAPYFHDGSISSLEEAVRLMARHQLGKELSPEVARSITTWLKSLTGTLPADYIAKPTLPESGPATPPPDPE